jgi:hypothetical protein
MISSMLSSEFGCYMSMGSFNDLPWPDEEDTSSIEAASSFLWAVATKSNR